MTQPVKLRGCLVLVLLLSSALALADGKPAPRIVIFDKNPKTIMYLTNSHGGHKELQELLNRMGYPNITVKEFDGWSTYLDVKTGEPNGQWLSVDYSKQKHPVIFITTMGLEFPKIAPKSTPEQIKTWRIQSELEERLFARDLAGRHGVREVFFATYHWHPKHGEAGPGPDEKIEAPKWIGELNERVGLPIAFDVSVVTHEEYPLTVKADRYHASRFGNLLRAREMIRAMLKYDGREDIAVPDLAADREDAVRKERLIRVVLDPPPPWRVGQTVRIDWKTDPQIVERVSIWIYKRAGARLIDVVPSEPGRLEWTIPETIGHHPDGKPFLSAHMRLDEPPARTVGDDVSIQVVNASKPGREFAVTEPFSILPSDGPLPATRPASPSTKKASRPVKESEIQLARFHWFYRGGLTIVYDHVPAGEVAAFADMLANRERPDLASIVPADNESKRILERWGHETADRVEDGWQVAGPSGQPVARVTKAVRGSVAEAPAYVPGQELDFRNLRALRVDSLDPQTTRALCERVIAERKWMIVVVDRPGPKEKESTDLLHEYHDQMWNAPLGTIGRYLQQSAGAKAKVTSRSADRVVIELQTSSGAEALPLSMQIPLPEGWVAFKAIQNDKPVWSALVGGRMRWSAMPGRLTLQRVTPD